MRTPPLRAVVCTLVRTGGPQPKYEVDWTRTVIRVYDTGFVYKKVEAFMFNRKGTKARRCSGWVKVGPLRDETVEHYRERMICQMGFSDLEV